MRGIRRGTGASTASATEWDLNQLASLRFWIDASASATRTVTGSGISQINDKSGQGNHATQGTDANRPAVLTAEENGLDMLDFASGDSLTLPNFLTGSTAGSAFFVFKIAADPPPTGGPIHDWGPTGQNHHPFTDGDLYDDFGHTVRDHLGNPSFSMASLFLMNVDVSSGGTYKCFLNGTQFASVAGQTIGWNAGTPTIGGRIFKLAEVAFCNASLQAAVTDRQKAEGRLAHKWGIEASLDGAHPYKSVPP